MRTHTFLWICGAVILGTGCSQQGYESQKQNVLSQALVLGDSSGSATGQLTQPGTEPSPTPTPAPPGSTQGTVTQPASPSPAPAPTPAPAPVVTQAPAQGQITQPPYFNNCPGMTSMPVERDCSDWETAEQPDLKGAVAEGGTVVLQINGVTCTSNPQTVLGLALQTSITIADLRAACPGVLPAGGQINLALLIDGYNSYNIYISPGLWTILYARNQNTSDPAQDADANCTLRASPLVVHQPANNSVFQPVSLTSISKGIDYDLLGARNGYHDVKIGWFTNLDYAVLVLPNKQGEVLGIDQLFGNNTLGPDGHFAGNGYLALAKYDGTTADGIFHVTPANGRIDHQDAVFQRLRLWKDSNFDGIVQPEELMTLDQAGIAAIDLDYSANFQEVDQYGNKTMYKSVVSYANGTLDLIFDLWFTYQNLEGAQ